MSTTPGGRLNPSKLTNLARRGIDSSEAIRAHGHHDWVPKTNSNELTSTAELVLQKRLATAQMTLVAVIRANNSGRIARFRRRRPTDGVNLLGYGSVRRIYAFFTSTSRMCLRLHIDRSSSWGKAGVREHAAMWKKVYPQIAGDCQYPEINQHKNVLKNTICKYVWENKCKQ